MTSINPRAGLTVAGKTRTATQLSHTKFNAFHYVSSAAFAGTQTNSTRGSTSFLAFLTMGTLASRPNDFTPSVTYCELCAQTQIIYSNMLDLELQASLRISTKS